MIFLRKTWKYAVRIGCSILIEFPYKCFYINSFSLLGILMCSVCH